MSKSKKKKKNSTKSQEKKKVIIPVEKDTKKLKRISLWLLLGILLLSIGMVKKVFQNDTFYTIKIGELILKNGIDMKDHFSWHTGLPYTYPHWLYDVFINLVYKLGGYTSIYISSIVLFLILIYLIYKSILKTNNNYFMAVFTTLISTLALAGFVTARAQLVSFILFILEIYSIEMFLSSGRKRYLVFLYLIAVLLCNVHLAVWPFYYIIFIPYLVEYIICYFIRKKKKQNKFDKLLDKKFYIERNDNVKLLLITFIISLTAGLLTPLHGTPYTYMIKTMMGNSQKYIQEHQMISWKDSPFVIIIILETFFLSFMTKVKLRDIFMVSGLTIMAISSIRHVSLLALIGVFCFARIFFYFFDNNGLDTDKFLLKVFSNKIAIILFILVLSVTSGLLLNHQLKKDFIDKEVYPVEATKYILKNLDYKNIHLFNEYNFGSYLLLNNIPVFIDSRADLYTREFSGRDYDIFDDYEAIISTYQNKFKFYDITHALIYKKEPKTFYNILKTNINYKILYEDDYFALFEKLNDENIIVLKNSN